MQDYQTLALSYAEELSDLKRRCADLERHCRGLESKLSKTRGRMKLYRQRCLAWETALSKCDELYHHAENLGETTHDMAVAYGIGLVAAMMRNQVESAYRTDPRKIMRKVLNLSQINRRTEECRS